MVMISLNIGGDDSFLSHNVSMKRPLIISPKYKDSFNLSQLKIDDLSQLIDLKDFKFTINNRICHGQSFSLEDHGSADANEGYNDDGDDIFLLIFIHSAPRNFAKRKTIRETWASTRNVSCSQIRHVFLLGMVDDYELQRSIDSENKATGDIVQGNFLDTYRNLTYKHVMGLKWITYYCRNAKFILKTDDDIFVDVIQLVSHLKGLTANSVMPRRLLNCFVIRNPYPARSDKSKWKVTYEEYPGKYYPTYCFGWSVILSPDVVFDLYLQSRSTPYFWVDDVYVTGLLAQKANIDQTDIGPKLAISDQEIERWVENKETLTLPPLFVRPAAIKDLSTIYDLWNKTIKYYQFIK